MMRCFRFQRDEQGAVLVFLALILIVLMGIAALAIDLGQLYIARQRAQDVCDTAARSGMWCLFQAGDLETRKQNARDAAAACAAANNEMAPSWKTYDPVSGSPGVEVTFPFGTLADDAGRPVEVNDGEAVRTRAVVNVNFTFARFLGFGSRQVSASATAIAAETKNLYSVALVPLSISEQSIFGYGSTPPAEFGKKYMLHVSSWDSGFLGPGNFCSVCFAGDSGGTSTYRSRLAGDMGPAQVNVDELLGVDWTIETEPGLKESGTRDGLNARLQKETDPRFVVDNSNAWNNWLNSYDPATQRYAATWRIVIVPVIKDDDTAVNGRRPVQVIGLAGFFIHKVTSKGDIEGYYLQAIKRGEDIQWIFPVPGTTAKSTNLFRDKVHLIS